MYCDHDTTIHIGAAFCTILDCYYFDKLCYIIYFSHFYLIYRDQLQILRLNCSVFNLTGNFTSQHHYFLLLMR
ncbi:hypothetical protein ACJX0J_012680, partial [Zea mays]